MRWMPRIAVMVLVSSVAAVAGPIARGSAQATPSVTVTPSTGLVGGEEVTLAGTGFPPSSEIGYCQGISTGNPTSSDCAGGSFDTVGADSTGAFSVPLTVDRFIRPASTHTLVDCAQSTASCAIGAQQESPVFGSPIVTPISFTAQPPATFTVKGVVKGPEAQPLANVAVWAYKSSDQWVGSIQTVTDATGSYQLTVDPNVPYAIRFGPPAGSGLIVQWFDGQMRRSSANPIVWSSSFNDPVTTANAQLFGGGAIAGIVTGPPGTGVGGVTVSAYGPGDGWVGSFGTTTAADGSYSISGVAPNAYRIRFVPPAAANLATEWFHNAMTVSSATSVTVTAGSTTSNIDDQLSAAH
jgi:hypothetical protein